MTEAESRTIERVAACVAASSGSRGINRAKADIPGAGIELKIVPVWRTGSDILVRPDERTEPLFRPSLGAARSVATLDLLQGPL